MERKTKGKLDCKELSTGFRLNEHTLDALVTPGHYKIGACDVTPSEGFPEDVSQGRLSAYLEVTSTNHSSDRLKDNAIGQVLTVTDFDGVTNIYTRNRTNSNGINIWSVWSGVGGKSAGDIMDGAITAQKLSSDIRSNVVNPLRPLFIAAGAKYNDSTCFYELNGVYDLNEADIMIAYTYKDIVYNLDKGRLAQDLKSLRVFYPYRYPLPQDAYKYTGSLKGVQLFRGTSLEVFCVNPIINLDETRKMYSVPCLNLVGTFALCKKLHTIFPIDVSNCEKIDNETFIGCESLKELRILYLNHNLVLSDSKLISRISILYIINNAKVSSIITIALHPDAYLRLADDAEILSALEAQPLISLVSA